MSPALSVVVPAHGRPLRLRWLLNALEEQTLDRARWELLVVTTQPDLAELAGAHPAGARVVTPDGPRPAQQRNAGWRAARAPVVLFTDDDCRPPAGWLAGALAAVESHPGAVVQGATRPDPDEEHLLAAPHARTLRVDPPAPYGETCNIAYPVALLERLGGFDEDFPAPAGEDTDLLQRAIAAGAPHVGAPGALTYHAVEVRGLPGTLRRTGRWEALALVVKRHPGLRRHLVLRVFWKPSHAVLPAALIGLALGRRRPLLGAALVAPWAAIARPRYGAGPRGIARALSELPGRLAVDVAELLAALRGAVRHRTPFL